MTMWSTVSTLSAIASNLILAVVLAAHYDGMTWSFWAFMCILLLLQLAAYAHGRGAEKK